MLRAFINLCGILILSYFYLILFVFFFFFCFISMFGDSSCHFVSTRDFSFTSPFIMRFLPLNLSVIILLPVLICCFPIILSLPPALYLHLIFCCCCLYS